MAEAANTSAHLIPLSKRNVRLGWDLSTLKRGEGESLCF